MLLLIFLDIIVIERDIILKEKNGGFVENKYI